MSFSDSFGPAYRAAVESTPVPDDLAARIIGHAVQEGAAPAAARARNRCGTVGSRNPLRLRAARVIACAAAALALVAALPVALSRGEYENPPGGTLPQEEAPAAAQTDDSEAESNSPTPAPPGLALKAYAADGTELSAPEHGKEENDPWGEPIVLGQAPFALFYPSGASGSGADTLWPEEGGAITAAVFLPETFTLEGANIQRIQIYSSGCELYLQSIDRDVKGMLKVGLEGLDPRRRGSQVGYEDCDALSFYDRMEKDDAGRAHTHEDVFRMKRMGSVIDLSKEDDGRVGTRDIQFGLLALATSPDAKTIGQMSDNHFADTLPQPENPFDGTILTITATFDDGSCETQVIELHRESVVANDEGTEPAMPLRRYSDELFKKDPTPFLGKRPPLLTHYADELFAKELTAVDVAYGVLLSKTAEPFPYADEPANQYADTVMPPMPAFSQPYSID
ncbi:hypothetical protein [uncultured Adlercreutzia sp.]|uniref:hypothetical protein n=1 Tax=uncultured Adlercreutzia sp. TaxID=875803 RepID=UPI00267538BC|nr:hypothetical protein [uncultured Adlercreutzia sp.]